jgi:hypothetical protein
MLSARWTTEQPDPLVTTDWADFPKHCVMTGKYITSSKHTYHFNTPAGSAYAYYAIYWSIAETSEGGTLTYFYGHESNPPYQLIKDGLTFTCNDFDGGAYRKSEECNMYVTCYPPLPANFDVDRLFLLITINSKVIGRFKTREVSGSKELDIGQWCQSGTNTITVTLVGGVTPTDSSAGQTINGDVRQIRRLVVLENA